MVNLINLTPHQLNIKTQKGSIVNIEPSGTIARVAQSEERFGEVKDIEVTKLLFGEVEELPEADFGTYYIVSRIVASAASHRSDLLTPGQLIRDDDGKVIGARGLSVL